MIAGASLAGGLASVTSTWVAALALTLLTQVLLVLGLSQAMQFVVFGAAIVAGMIVSGDRIAAGLGKVLQHPRVESAPRRETVTGDVRRGGDVDNKSTERTSFHERVAMTVHARRGRQEAPRCEGGRGTLE